MSRSLYASGGIHAAIILWVAFGGGLFPDTDEVEFEITGVTLLSVSEFEALTDGAGVVPVAIETTEPVEAAPEPAPVARPEPEPEPEPAPPEPEVEPAPPSDIENILAPPAPESGAPDLIPDDTPTPEAADRIAPVPVAPREEDVAVAPEVIEAPSEPAPEEAETVVEAEPEAAPEEAATQIVTEAEEPSGGPLGPLASARPAARPARPEPVETVADTASEPETESVATTETADPLADAIAAAVTEAVDTPTAAVASGPPLSAGTRDGFRVAVQGCWNVGSLSTEAQGTTVVVAFDMARDGTPQSGTLRMIEFTGGSETAARQAFEAARRAILRCARDGYDLPEESYGRWAQVELVFNPEGMRLR